MIRLNSMKFTQLALCLAVMFGLASCSEYDLSVQDGATGYGVLSSKNVSEYYYPKEAGWTYIYKHTIHEYANGGNSVTATIDGPCDTLKTLGYINTNANGDSVFAFKVTYRVLQSRANKVKFPLYYFPKNGEANTGGFVLGNSKTGLTGLDSITSVAGAIDTILYVVEGPTRDVVDDYTSTGTRVWRTDIIYFTAKRDTVEIWWKDGTVMNRTRLLWYQDFDKNDEWQYAMSVGDPYTWWQVADEEESVTTTAGTFNTVKIEAFTDNLKTSTTEYKWWGDGVGMVKQYDEWRVSSNGQNFDKRTRVRELISRVKN